MDDLNSSQRRQVEASVQETTQPLAEHERRQEAEIMRDVMAALASAATMNQSLEIILVSLRKVIEYDRAGLFLIDESDRYTLAEKAIIGQDASLAIHQAHEPLVDEFRLTRRPIVVEDIQGDARFANWTDMQSVHGWLGAPLLAGDDLIGFLSLGSLQVAAYSEADAALLQALTTQVADVLERARLHDQSHRRSEELEVLSRITIALGQAETSESNLSVIMDLVTRTFGAGRCIFLFADNTNAWLTGNTHLDGTNLPIHHPRGDDQLWQVFNSGSAAMITDTSPWTHANQAEVYHLLYHQAQSAALIPLKSEDATFGLLCLTFEERRSFSAEDLQLFNAISEIAGTSLRRAVALERLEKQVQVRTQHLSTLYNINAIASERLDLQAILDQVLSITLEALDGAAGAVHLLNPVSQSLQLVADQNLSPELLARLQSLDSREAYWKELVSSTNPVVLPDFRKDRRLPAWFIETTPAELVSYIGTPIRAKGQPLGLMSILSGTIQDTTIEDITLFMTIADQIGISVERARLIKAAEHAAVMEERQRLARELHDSVTQLLYSQVLFAGAGLKVLNQGNLPLIRQHLNRIDQTALQALKEMRLLVYELRPSDYLEEGLVGALQRRLDSVEKRTGMNAQLYVEGHLNLDEATEMALYRIAQEALNNTLKHAGATSVQVSIHSDPGQVVLEIADNGCGFSLAEKLLEGGMGLATMRERTAALNGSLQIIAQPGQGTRVIARIEESK